MLLKCTSRNGEGGAVHAAPKVVPRGRFEPMSTSVLSAVQGENLQDCAQRKIRLDQRVAA